MPAASCRGPRRPGVEPRPMPRVERPRGAVVRVPRSCIRGSDWPVGHGLVPDPRVGTTFGPELRATRRRPGAARPRPHAVGGPRRLGSPP